MSAEQMRKEFEAWAAGRGFSAHRDTFLPGAPYMAVLTAGAWEAWQWQAALATQPQAPQGAVTPGFKLVPVEPTAIMLDEISEAIKDVHESGNGAWGECGGVGYGEAKAAYAAMLLAAPETPEGKK